MNPISFGSTFIIKSNRDDYNQALKHDAVLDYCEKKGYEYCDNAEKNINPGGRFGNYSKSVISVPDYADKGIEGFCTRIGMWYKKITTNAILSKFQLINRIKRSFSNDKTLVTLDSQKLDELLSKQDKDNFKLYKKEYEDYYKKDFDNILKRSLSITPSTLRITADESAEKVLSKTKYGAIAPLNPNSLTICLEGTEDEEDKYMYFAMKNAGIEKIPVYVDDDTLVLCVALGLLR